MQALEGLRDDLKRKIAELQQQLAGVEMSIRVISGGAIPVKMQKGRAPRSNVKQYLLTLLEEAGVAGINASKAVEIAADRGESLERGTVSSLLSRLKADSVVTYDGTAYRLNKFSAPHDSTERIH